MCRRGISSLLGKITVVVVICICISGTEIASADGPPVQWQKTFGGSEGDFGQSVQQTSDGGYVIGGVTLSFGAGNRDVYLIKTEPNGNSQWQKTFGGSENDICRSVQQTSDGGYVIAGYTLSFGAGDWDVYLIKTEPNGTVQWEKTFGGSEGDLGWSVQQTSDGGYVIAGWTYSFGAVGNDVYLIKTEPNGTMQWEKTFGGSESDGGRSVQQTADGGYIIAGHTSSFGAGGTDFYLIKTEPNGSSQWEKTFGGSEEDWGGSIQQTSDGGYVISGVTDSFGAGGNDVYIIKTDPNGIMQWQKTFGGSFGDEDWSVQQTSDGGYVIAGNTSSFGAGGSDVYLIKTEPNGSLQWQKTFGGSASDSGWSVQQTSDGGYVIAGSTQSFGAGSSDVYLIKLCSEGTLSGDLNCDGIVDAEDLDIFVNQWLQPRSISLPPADIFGVGDGETDFNDFAVIGNQWQTTGPRAPDDMVYIPDGEFEMGDHFAEGNPDELPVHAVYLDSFFMSKFEITNQQYCDYLNSAILAGDIKVVGGIVYGFNDTSNNYRYCDTHSYDVESQIDYLFGIFSVRYKGGRDMSDDPMVEVSWYGAAAYCNWRSSEEGYESCYDLSTWECDFSKHGYRLPTEAEWEHAARGGLSGKRFPWDDPNITHSLANYYSSSSYPFDVSPTRGYHPVYNDGIYPYTAPVGSFSANGYGLYDMAGNVWEWCNDWYDGNYYDISPYDNPQGPVSGILGVVRGGSWHINYTCRVAFRDAYSHASPLSRYDYIGFRVVLDLN